MNDADWQLGMSTICWWLQLSGEETQKTTTPSFFSQINIQPQTFESGNKGQKRNPSKYITHRGPESMNESKGFASLLPLHHTLNSFRKRV